MKTIFLFTFMSLITAQTFAESNRPFSEMKGDCSNYATDIHQELSQWNGDAKAVEAGAKLVGDSPEIFMGEKALVQLLPLSRITLATPLDEAKQQMYSGKYGGFIKFRAPKSGNYRFSSGGKAWMGLLGDRKKNVEAYSFEMQTGCKKIFKVVSFHLKKGKTYSLQITGSEKGNLAVLVTRAEKI